MSKPQYETYEQPQYAPLPVEKQVAIIWAATNGLLDDVVHHSPHLNRRADKLRFISWANLLVCVGVGLFSDIGDTATRWSIAMGWSVRHTVMVLYGVTALLSILALATAQVDR